MVSYLIIRIRCQLHGLPVAIALGNDTDEVAKILVQHGIGRNWAKQVLEIAQGQGRFTIFAMVDALTRSAGEMKFAGERAEFDQKAEGLLAAAAAFHFFSPFQ